MKPSSWPITEIAANPFAVTPHLPVMPPGLDAVSPKLQKSTLDPSKISGRCGQAQMLPPGSNKMYTRNFSSGLPAAKRACSDQQGQRSRAISRNTRARKLLVEFRGPDDGSSSPLSEISSQTFRLFEAGDPPVRCRGLIESRTGIGRIGGTATRQLTPANFIAFVFMAKHSFTQKKLNRIPAARRDARLA